MAVTERIRIVLCALKIYLNPHTVLRKRGLHIFVRQLGSGAGEGQHTVTMRDFRYQVRSESRRPIKGAGSGQSASVLRSVR